MRDIQPSADALHKARKMGREAAKNDTWMIPCPQEHQGDINEVIQAHRDSWASTTHFQHLYGNQLSSLADKEEERLTGRVGGLSHLDLARYEGLYIPLRDEFFEAWEEACEEASGDYYLMKESQ